MIPGEGFKWINTVSKFKDTHRLSPAANYFDEHGFYTSAPKGTKAYYDFWDEEKARCLYGYTTPEGDITISGFHYFYLNYCRIKVVKDEILPDGSTRPMRKQYWPRFYDNDYKYFTNLEKCRDEDKHMVVLKARRKGYSYKAASMLARNYFLIKNSKNFVFAGMKEYLTGVDAILTKTWEIVNFIDANTAWTQPRLLDTAMAKTAGYKKKVSGQFIDAGVQSSIAGVSLKDDPDKVRGKAGELIFFEEAGAFPGLLEAWGMAMPTMRQGNKTLGTMIAFGTGGTEGDGFEALEELFYHPETYDCMAFENEWEEGMSGTQCGYFVPIYEILDGFIDDDGNSLITEAKEFEQGEREKKRGGNDASAYDQYLAEHPFSPAEATLQVSSNLFDLALIQEQYNKVRAKALHVLGTAGDLTLNTKGEAVFRPNGDRKQITKYPHRKGDDVNGAIVVYETPHKVEGKVPNLLYFLCHDPYGQNQSSDSRSLGSAYVIKRVNNVSKPDDMIVASYVGRPKTQDDYNNNMFLLAQYYNAKIGFENDRGDVIGFAKRFRKLHFLQEEFEMLDKKELRSRTVKRNYGMHMTEARKRQGELYIRDWLQTPRGKNIDGKQVYNVHKIYDLALLQELIKFNHKGNFDRVMSLMIGMYHTQELYNAEVSEVLGDRSVDEWFDNQYQ